VIQFVNAVAMSLLVVLVVDDEIVVPVTTGLPAGRLYVPEPLKAIIVPLYMMCVIAMQISLDLLNRLRLF
jgi:hypothetical protein